MKLVFSRFKKGGWQWEGGQARPEGGARVGKREKGSWREGREKKGGISRQRAWWSEGEGVEQGVWFRKG